MSDFERLDSGFTNWRGKRVFVPSFGAPRIVPTAEDEVRILRMEFGMDIVLAVYIVALFITARWLAAHVGTDTFVFGIILLASGILSIVVVLSILRRRWLRRWPLLSTARFSRSRFILEYLRSMSVLERLFELFWGLCGLLVFAPFLADQVRGVVDNPAGLPTVGKLLFSGIVASIFGIATFRSARLVLLGALALTRRFGRLPVSGGKFDGA